MHQFRRPPSCFLGLACAQIARLSIRASNWIPSLWICFSKRKMWLIWTSSTERCPADQRCCTRPHLWLSRSDCAWASGPSGRAASPDCWPWSDGALSWRRASCPSPTLLSWPDWNSSLLSEGHPQHSPLFIWNLVHHGLYDCLDSSISVTLWSLRNRCLLSRPLSSHQSWAVLSPCLSSRSPHKDCKSRDTSSMCPHLCPCTWKLSWWCP